MRGEGCTGGVDQHSDKYAVDGVYYVGWWPCERADFVGVGGAGDWAGGQP